MNNNNRERHFKPILMDTFGEALRFSPPLSSHPSFSPSPSPSFSLRMEIAKGNYSFETNMNFFYAFLLYLYSFFLEFCE